MVYEIVVTNSGGGAGRYDVEDTLGFPAGVTVTPPLVVVADPASIVLTAGWDGDAQPEIASDVLIAGAADPADVGTHVVHTYTITVTGTVGDGFEPGAAACEAGEPEHGLFNAVELTWGGGGDDDDACAPLPSLSFEKSFDGASFDGDEFEATYTITVTNTGLAGSLYDLEDTLGFPAGVTVAPPLVVVADPASIVLTAGWDGDAQPVIATGVEIDGAVLVDDAVVPVVHTYTITVTGTITNDFDPADAACDATEGQGHGLFNSASLQWAGRTEDPSADCGDIPTLRIAKSVTLTREPDIDGEPWNGGDVLPGDELTWTITIENTSAVPYSGVVFTDDLTSTLAGVGAIYDLVSSDASVVVPDVAEVNTAGELTATAVDMGPGVVTVSYTGTVLSHEELIGDGENPVTTIDNVVTPDNPLTECPVDMTVQPGPVLFFAVLAAIDESCETNNPLTPVVHLSKAVATSGNDDYDGFQVVPGQELTWTITIANISSVNYTGDLFEDDLTSVLAGVGTLTAGPESSDDTLVEVTWVSPNLSAATTAAGIPAGTTVTVTYTGTVLSQDELNAGNVESIDNVVVPTGEVPECVEDCDTTNPLTPVVAVSKAVTSGDDDYNGVSVGPGQALTWTITVQNRSTVPFTGDLFTDDLSSVLAGVGTLTQLPVASNPAVVQVNWSSPNLSAAAAGLMPGQTVTVTYGGTVRSQAQLNELGVTSIDNLLVPTGEVPECIEDCETINPALPVVDIAKTHVSTTGTAGSFTVVYRIAVTNVGTVNARYSLSDQLRFGEGVVIGGATISLPAGVVFAVPAWDGVDNLVVASDVLLPTNGTHTYTVTVQASAPASVSSSARDCELTGGETGTGLRNVATVTHTGGSGSDDACGPVPPVPPTPPPGELPATGAGDVTMTLLLFGAALALAGLVAVLISRRRPGAELPG